MTSVRRRGTGADEGPRRATVPALTYTAFISYSHAGDRKIAAALQSALHSFSKPWYRLRAMRVFRDDASLSANPGLWTSIEQALTKSEFLVLLASPEAAHSEWVAKEVGYWCRTKPRSHLLLVLTDGEVEWDDATGKVDWVRSSALPASLEGTFEEEPRFVDLRWARDGGDLTLAEPRFLDAVADLASAIRRQPKDDLKGDDVRQHRRVVRLARSAVALLTVLALAASAAAVVAIQNAATANDQRRQAIAQTRLARSRQLSAEALNNLDGRLDRSLLLSLEAVRAQDTPEARNALLRSIQHEPRPTYFLAGGLVQAVAFSPDGARLGVGAQDGSVTLWDPRHAEVAGVALRDTGSPVLSLAFSGDGATLASGQEDGTIVLWDVAGGQARVTVTSDSGAGSLSFGRDGILASAHANGAVRFWDKEGQPVGALRALVRNSQTGIAFSPSGTLLAVADSQTIFLWHRDTQEMELLVNRRTYAPFLGAPAFSPKGDTLAIADGGSFALWDVASRKPTYGRDAANEGVLPPSRRRALSVAFAPDGSLVLGNEDGTVGHWDVRTARLLANAPSGQSQRVIALAVSSTGMTAAAGDDEVVSVRNVVEPDAAPSPLERRLARLGPTQPADVLWTPRHDVAAIFNPDAVIIWDAVARRQVGPPLPIRGTDVDRAWLEGTGKVLAVRKLGQVTFWDLRTRRPTVGPSAFNISDVAFNSGGDLAAWKDYSEDVVRLWDVANGRAVDRVLRAPFLGALGLAFGPSGKTVVAWGSSKVDFWDVDGASEEPSEVHDTDRIVVSPDATMYADLRSDPGPRGAVGPGSVVIHDLESRRQVGSFEVTVDPSLAYGFSPDGNVLVVSNRSDLRLWDVRMRRFLPSPALTSGDRVTRTAFASDSRRIAFGTDRGSTFVWDLARAELVGPPFTDRGAVSDLALSPDGRTLASIRVTLTPGGDAAESLGLTLSDVGSGQAVGTALAGQGRSEFLPDGDLRVAAADGREDVVWRMASGWPALACAQAHRNLTKAEWERYIGPIAAYIRTCEQYPSGLGAPAGAPATVHPL